MPDENFLSKSWQTNTACFITFPIPAIFCAYNLRAGCAEQPLTMNYPTASYISFLGEDMGLQESAFGLSAACTSCPGTAFPLVTLPHSFHIRSVTIQTKHSYHRRMLFHRNTLKNYKTKQKRHLLT